jgi:PAS domain S-box-containing protein
LNSKEKHGLDRTDDAARPAGQARNNGAEEKRQAPVDRRSSEKPAAGTLRRRAEKMMDGQGPVTPPMSRDDMVNLVHELEVHQIELELQKDRAESIRQKLEEQNVALRSARQALGQSRDRYADLYNNAPVGYFTIAAKTGRILEANLTGLAMLGLDKQGLRRSRFTRHIEHGLADRFRACLEKAASAGQAMCELQMHRTDGAVFRASLEIRGAPENPYVRLALTDVTARKEMESELRIKDYAFTSSVAGIAITDLEGNLTYVNPALYRMGGHLPTEVIGRPARLFFAEGPAGEAALREAIEKGSWQGELAVRRKDGSVFVAQTAASLVRDEAGTPVCLMASLMDITERKRAEQIKDEFIGLVSHELRTPLTVFMGAVRVAQTEGISAGEVRELLQEAAQSADALSHILDNLIELSRYQSDRLNLNTVPTDIRQAVGEVLSTEAGHASRHRLTFSYEDGLPEVEVDQLRLRQILRNLIDNAAKYSPAGTEIRILLKQDKGNVVVGVCDRGKGISPAEQAKLFQPYQRLGDTQAEGLGLGLLVCRRLVEAHGGTVWVESEPGRGSTFWFSLPLPGGTGAADPDRGLPRQ